VILSAWQASHASLLEFSKPAVEAGGVGFRFLPAGNAL
jgi:hypothetical protein